MYNQHTYLGVPFSEASGLLLLCSLLVLNEGTIRYMNLVQPDGTGLIPLNVGRPATGWLFFAAIAEMIFGFMGLFLGVAGFVFRYYNTTVVQICMTLQAILGIFVFIVYVFVQPGFLAADASSTSAIPGLSIGMFKFLVTLGIFTSSHFCLALQGGQFVFMARMISAATGDDFLRQRSGDRMRASFWSMNITLAGLWTLMTGSIINSQVGSGKLEVVYMFAPNVGKLPGFTVVTGLCMMFFGLAGIAFAMSDTIAPQAYYVAAILVFLLTWLNYTIGQLSMVGTMMGASMASMHSGLVFMLMLMGTYFVWCFSKESGFLDEKL